jgi:apolipoprotein N-acyltransferase
MSSVIFSPSPSLSDRLQRPAAWGAAHPRLAALVLGALSALALPPLHLLPVLLVAVPWLLILIGHERRLRGAASLGWCFGFGHHLVGLYWITEAILVRADEFWWLVPIAVPLLAAVLAVFIAVPCAIARAARPGWPRVLALAGAWVLADLARQFVATGFPWNLWGSVWEMPGRLGDVFIQPAAVIGLHGMTLLTLLLAATPALGRRAMAGGLAGLVLWAGFGLWHLARPVLPVPDLTVVLVQGNVPEGQKMDRSFAVRILRGYLLLTRQAIAELAARAPGAPPPPAVVVWPESASLFPLDTDVGARAAFLAASGGAPGLLGSIRFDAEGRARNSLIGIQGGTDAAAPVSVYDKFHLVPFGEYQPDWLPLPVQIVPGGGFAKGSGPVTMDVPGVPPVGPLICYEAIFPGAVVDPSHRPGWLVNVTNDAWFGNSSGPRQHLAAARARAVEEGLPLMRAANTGISAGFDAFGHELGRLGMNVAGTLELRLPGALPQTVFARFGLAVPGALAAVSLLLGLLARGGVRKAEREAG